MRIPHDCGAIAHQGRIYTFSTVTGLHVWTEIDGHATEVESTPDIRRAIWLETLKAARKLKFDPHEDDYSRVRSWEPHEGKYV